jgi:hypothetical protein
MTKSKEELIDYQKNFKQSFENPAEHDAAYLAWKNACELKNCVDKESYPHTRKESEFPSKMIDYQTKREVNDFSFYFDSIKSIFLSLYIAFNSG